MDEFGIASFDSPTHHFRESRTIHALTKGKETNLEKPMDVEKAMVDAKDEELTSSKPHYIYSLSA